MRHLHFLGAANSQSSSALIVCKTKFITVAIKKIKEKGKRELNLPDWCNPSDKPPQPAKISNVAKQFALEASLWLSCSKSSSPSLHFPFFLRDAASPVSSPVEYLSLIWTGNCPQNRWKKILHSNRAQFFCKSSIWYNKIICKLNMVYSFSMVWSNL